MYSTVATKYILRIAILYICHTELWINNILKCVKYGRIIKQINCVAFYLASIHVVNIMHLPEWCTSWKSPWPHKFNWDSLNFTVWRILDINFIEQFHWFQGFFLWKTGGNQAHIVDEWKLFSLHRAYLDFPF